MLSSASTTGTRYCSLAQAPRSAILHRSEQNGRNRFSARHSTRAPQCGQATVSGGLLSEVAEREFELDIGIGDFWPLQPFLCGKADVQRIFVGADFRHAHVLPG